MILPPKGLGLKIIFLRNFKLEQLQNILLPSHDFSAPEDMYVRTNDRTTIFAEPKRIEFRIGGKAWFDTYYNSVSVGALKRITSIDNLYLALEGQGRFLLKIGLHRLGNPRRWLMEKKVRLPLETPLALPWSSLEDGMLYVALESMEEGVLTGGGFLTDAQTSAPVKLGVVITHFNRKLFVVPAIARIREQLLSQPELAGKIELIVVDNSKNLTAEEALGATLIPNHNYGGSGGFTRGLLHLIDNSFTHCLFMDDDATCEIESIRRTYMLQCFAAKPELAISGALLNEIHPSILIEKGAVYKEGVWRALNHDRDVVGVRSLLEVEQVRERCIYGAWWFFCFKISEVKAFPFPFFVRGDDVLFGIMNNFDVETINGISCWGEEFSLKESPSARYLSLRGLLTIALKNKKTNRVRTIKVIAAWLSSSFLSYNYGSASAILNAIEDVTKGPKFWVENIDMGAVRAKLAPLNAEEKMVPISLADYDFICRGEHEGRLRRLIRKITLNGMLLPSFLLRDQTVFEIKSFRANFRRVFRFKRVLYYSESTKLGYIAILDQRRFLSIMIRSIGILGKFFFNFPQLRNDYQKALPEMTSEAFWRKIYQGKGE